MNAQQKARILRDANEMMDLLRALLDEGCGNGRPFVPLDRTDANTILRCLYHMERGMRGAKDE